MVKAGELMKDIRFQMDEFYVDLLANDAFQRGTSMAQQASSLLGGKLIEREKHIVNRNKYLAWLRGVTPAKLWLDIRLGEAKSLTDEEIKKLREQGLIDESGEIPGLGE
ncbi:MAG: hypothetical protein F6J86_40135 [Symploca sp. SIO1B1]|nr:hypothetical protein [Symploca sp. SIO1B1]NET61969.1 hypothetical protein [Symploca sp. SIO2E6]